MRLSLVVGTVGRQAELDRFFASQSAQSSPAHQVIIVDQNGDDRLAAIVARYADSLPVLHIRTAIRGLSRARNLGLNYVTGDIVGIPDDDCWYETTINAEVLSEFKARPEMDILCGCSVDASRRPSQGRWRASSTWISRYKVWTTQTSNTTFYRRSIFAKIGRFDERLGVGSGTAWGSGEETDLLLRAVGRGMRAYYKRELEIYHPEPVVTYDGKSLARTRSYSRGLGYLLRVHRFPWWFVSYMCVRPLIGSVVAVSCLRTDLAKYRLITSKERFDGYLSAERG